MKDTNEKIKNEVYCGIWPVLGKERTYGFLDALLVLSGYCIATWSYTQGSYLASLVGFKQLLIGAFLGAILMLAIYQLPVILSTRYGIDIWVWLRTVFGKRGVKVMTVVIILINYPWYAVCCDLFASSMENLFGLFGVTLPEGSHLMLGLFCVILGTFIAYRGVSTITWTTRILVPLLLLVGIVVVIVGFSAVPAEVIWNYKPEITAYDNNITPYILSIEANFAFVITLVGGMAEIPRLCKSEKSGYYAGVLGQGLAGSFFVVVGAVMAIAMQYVTGEMVDDPTLMMATLSIPALGLTSLLLVAFANIGTQAVGSYLYGVMLKSSFRKADYRLLVIILGVYVGGLCAWGKIVEYFGSFLTISACVYAPLAALLFTDFFFVRKQRIDLKSAYEMEGHNAYQYTKGFNIVGLLCLLAGFFISLAIYNPVTGEIHNSFLFTLTPTGCSFLGTGILYYLLCQLPWVRRYVRKDTELNPVVKPFDRVKIPPKQNLFAMPFLWLYCYIITWKANLKIVKSEKRGIKPPFLVLGTHHSFTDFYVTPLTLFPYRANYVSELEGFEYYGEWLYRQIGCLGTRKFVDDLSLIKNIKKVMERKGILVFYPEARYANVGTSSKLPMSVAKLVKMLKVPVVTLNMKGNYLQSPIWNLTKRKEVKLHTEMTYALTKQEVRELSVDEIYEKLSELLAYDEYAWQREQKMAITYKKRAEGLHLPLYQCRCCKVEFQMDSEDNKLFCRNCGVEYEMDEYGTLRRDNEERYIPDWYEWQRKQVKAEINNHTYSLDCKVEVYALPNAKNFICCGVGHLLHDLDGYQLTFHNYLTDEEETLVWTPAQCFSVHTEYNYRNMGQCITLSTLDDSFFLFPVEEGFNATKIQFATEYMYELHEKKVKEEKK
ncbi:MAG: cytosine permease [Lachnospiraceae bacterium]|nr:cytosine permease [Lachnospiraceae bacterium]